jgi:galactonate dehydratase
VDLRATVVGDNPSDVERLAWNVQVAEYGRPGEVACWDPLGQALGVPIWKLLLWFLAGATPAASWPT